MTARRWRRRPLAETERAPAFVAASAVLVLLAVAALFALPHQRTAPRPTTRTSPVGPRPAPVPRTATAPVPSQNRGRLIADAREFLAGYLAYLYRGADAQTIPRVSIPLRRTLAQHRPSRGHRSQPRTRLLDVQIVAVGDQRAKVRATLVDDTGATFPIALALRHHRTGWEASNVGR